MLNKYFKETEPHKVLLTFYFVVYFLMIISSFIFNL